MVVSSAWLCVPEEQEVAIQGPSSHLTTFRHGCVHLRSERGRSVVHACHNLAEDMTVCTTMSEDHGVCQKSERGLVVQTSWCVGGFVVIFLYLYLV